MPTNLLRALIAEKGHATQTEIWRDTVNALLHGLLNHAHANHPGVGIRFGRLFLGN